MNGALEASDHQKTSINKWVKQLEFRIWVSTGRISELKGVWRSVW
jgi:hypothetical protein